MKSTSTKEIAQRVYAIVKSIPRGFVLTYGDVARRAKISSPRHVGYLLHHNPDPAHIPCHRVVFADGRLTPAFAFGGITEHAARLTREGVRVVKGRVDLKKVRVKS